MSYLLIGNISALISEDCIEPLANARIRIYLPGDRYDTEELARGIFKDLQQLSERDVEAKADYLLAESALDERGNFSLGWDDIHLFTEPLEMDICLNSVPGKHAGKEQKAHWVQYHLSTLVPHWKRSRDKYLAAFAYVVPSDKWSGIRSEFGSWVISGAVKHAENHEGLDAIRVEAYNALNDKLLGWCNTNENGRYKLYFSRKEISGSHMLHLWQNEPAGTGPDVYFKLYWHNELIWSEHKDTALQPERQSIKPCTKLNLFIKPPVTDKRLPGFSGWFNDFIHNTKTKSQYKDLHLTY